MAWFGGLVWSAKLDKLALGNMARQNVQVRVFILGIFLLGMAVWFGLQNLTKLALGVVTRQNFLFRVLILEIFFRLIWRFGLVSKT